MKKRTAFGKHNSEAKPASRLKIWAGAALLATAFMAKSSPAYADKEKPEIKFSYVDKEVGVKSLEYLDKEFKTLGEKKFREIYADDVEKIGRSYGAVIDALIEGKSNISEDFLFEIIVPEIRILYDGPVEDAKYNLYNRLGNEESDYYAAVRGNFLEYLAENFSSEKLDRERKINLGYALMYFSRDEVTKLRDELGIEYFARYPPHVLENCLNVFENKGPQEGQKLLLVMGGKDDFNGAFYYYKDLKEFHTEGYDFLIMEVSDSEELYDGWEWFAENMNTAADVMLIRAHGTPKTFQLGGSEFFEMNVLELMVTSYMDLFHLPHRNVSIYNKKRNIIKEDGIILFRSCSTGLFESGIASMISELFKVKTFAPPEPCWLKEFYFDENGLLAKVEYENEYGKVEASIFEPSTGEHGPPLITYLGDVYPNVMKSPFDYMRHSIGGIFSGSSRIHTSVFDQNNHYLGYATKGEDKHFLMSAMYSLRFEIKNLIVGAYFAGNTLSGTSTNVNMYALPWAGKVSEVLAPFMMLAYMPAEDEWNPDRITDFSGGAFLGGRTGWHHGRFEFQGSFGGGYSSAGDFSLIGIIYLRKFFVGDDKYTPVDRFEFIFDGYMSGLHKDIKFMNLSSHLSYRHKNIGGILSAYGGKISDSAYFSGDLELFWLYHYPGYLSTSFGGSWSRINEEWLNVEYQDWYATLNTGAMFSMFKVGVGAGVGTMDGEPHVVLKACISPFGMGLFSEMVYQSVKDLR